LAQTTGKVDAPAADPVRWLEAVVAQAPAANSLRTGGLILQLPGGARLEIADRQQAQLAAAFVRALEHAGAPC
jgi:hypothetical protein